MAKTATSTRRVKPKTTAKPAKSKATKAKASKAKSGAKSTAGDAFFHLLQSPLVAELAATAAAAAIASFAAAGASKSKNSASKVVKAAGLAAASAIGQRLTTEVTAIRKSAKPKR